MICSEPPKKIYEMRPRHLGNSVYRDFPEIHIFHALAINVDFEIVTQPRDPFGNAPFGAMPLIDEG
jgi:hypothetical protein